MLVNGYTRERSPGIIQRVWIKITLLVIAILIVVILIATIAHHQR